MGFLSGFGRILQGKPVFSPNEVNQNEQQIAAKLGGKVVPTVRLGRVECHVDGDKMDIYVDVHNESAANVYLDKIHLLGAVRELDTELKAGQAKQLHVFSGSAPDNDNEHMAKVQYRTDSGDYFEARHQVRYHQDSGGCLRVTELRLETPIVDIQ